MCHGHMPQEKVTVGWDDQEVQEEWILPGSLLPTTLCPCHCNFYRLAVKRTAEFAVPFAQARDVKQRAAGFCGL